MPGRKYVDPSVLHKLLVNHVIAKSINPDHVMCDELALCLMKQVEECAKASRFRNYFNGWKEDMKSLAHEHLCTYCHKYNIHYTETDDYFVKFIFREKKDVLEKYIKSLGIDYKMFYMMIPEKTIKTPNGKNKSKIAKHLTASILEELIKEFLCDPYYSISVFKPYAFEHYNKDGSLKEAFDSACDRNSFNYISAYINNAFKAIISEEKRNAVGKLNYLESKRYYIDPESSNMSLDDLEAKVSKEVQDSYYSADITKLDFSHDLY